MNNRIKQDQLKRPQYSLLHHFIRGAIGKEYLIKRCSGRRVITRYPDMTHITPSPRQEKQRSRFKEAAEFAKKVLADEGLKKEIQQLTGCGNYIYTAAIGYFMKKEKRETAKALLQTDQLLQEALGSGQLPVRSLQLAVCS